MGKKSGEDKKFYFLALRYLILLVFAIVGVGIFHRLFKPLTVYPVFFFLSIFYDVVLDGIIIEFADFAARVHIVDACIAGSAYLLLLILNLTTPLQIKKRLHSILFLFGSFLLVNIIRIFVFSIIFIYSQRIFDVTHMLSWYLFSAVLVFMLWVVNIKVFKIREIPVYSDFIFLVKIIKK